MDSGHVCVESGISKKIKAKNIFVFISRENYICYFYQYFDGLEEEKSPREDGVYTGRF